jgi:hypothetical protein
MDTMDTIRLTYIGPLGAYIHKAEPRGRCGSRRSCKSARRLDQRQGQRMAGVRLHSLGPGLGDTHLNDTPPTEYQFIEGCTNKHGLMGRIRDKETGELTFVLLLPELTRKGDAAHPLCLKLSQQVAYSSGDLAALCATASAQNVEDVKDVCSALRHAKGTYWQQIVHVYSTADGKWVEVYRCHAAKKYLCSWCDTSRAACKKRKEVQRAVASAASASAHEDEVRGAVQLTSPRAARPSDPQYVARFVQARSVDVQEAAAALWPCPQVHEVGDRYVAQRHSIQCSA